jgi:hypothetical protein
MDNRPEMRSRAALAVLAFAMFLVASCAPSVPSATVPGSAESSPTPPLSATEAPTNTPTATSTPTETPDPNMPDGATGKDAQGNYIKIENGLTVVRNTELNTWERHLNLDDQDIPLIVWDQIQHNVGFHDQVLLTVRISDKVPGFEKAGSISLHPGANVDDLPGGNPFNFSNIFLADVIQKYTGSFLITDPGWFDQGKISFSFTTSERPDPWVWNLGPETKVIVDVLDKPIGNGFQKADDPWAKGSLQKGSLQVRLFTEGGNLHLWIVPGSPLDQLTKEQWMEIFLYAPAQVIDHSDQRVSPFSDKLSTYIALTTKPSHPPFIDIGPPQ